MPLDCGEHGGGPGDDRGGLCSEFDAAHGTSGAVMRMFDIPPCGLPLPNYRDVDRLFLVRSWEKEEVLDRPSSSGSSSDDCSHDSRGQLVLLPSAGRVR